MENQIKKYLLDGFDTIGMKKWAKETDKPVELLETLWSIIIENEYPYQWRAAWFFEQVMYYHPKFANDYFLRILEYMSKFNHPGQWRHSLKVILLTDIEIWDLGKMLDLGYELMMDESKPAATRVYAMEIIYQIVRKESDLKNEFIESLRLINIEGGASIKSRVKKNLARLKKLK